MKIKKNGGHIVHTPLSFAFQMLELGGSYIQKYNTIKKEYVPDRTITPYMLKPKLSITDPDGGIPAGEYTSYLVNVVWDVTSYLNNRSTKLTNGTDYRIDSSTHAIIIMRNTVVDETIHISFTADYLDKTRNQTYQFAWDKDMTTISESEYKTSLEFDQPAKVNLSPFKNRGQFSLNAQLKNGDENLDDKLCTYNWEFLDNETKTWKAISDENLWYVSGQSTKVLTVDQDFIQKAIIRITAYPKAEATQQHTKTVMLRRFYGQYDPETYFVDGKYIFPDTTHITIGAKVTNRQGNIAKATRYFDMEIFYRKNSSSDWESIGYGDSATILRDAKAEDHQTGLLCRELSALLPLTLDDGRVLCDNEGNPIVAQVPTSEREVD